MSKFLVTGGAGFIGSHIVDRLISDKHEVIVIDSLEEQVHHGMEPKYLNKHAKYIFSRIRDVMFDKISDVDYIIHCASKVGVSQSNSRMLEFVSKNIYDTSSILQDILYSDVKKIIHCGSMAPYGDRDEPIPIKENEPTNVPLSFYGITKQTQEDMIHLFGHNNYIDTISLRFFSVYGSRQALDNPYAGPIPIFIKKSFNNDAIDIFDDGNQTRDFVHVSDVVNSVMLALKSNYKGESYNIGTGISTSIKSLADTICKLSNSKSHIHITHEHRSGDIKHSLANITKAKRELGYIPKTKLEDGLNEAIK